MAVVGTYELTFGEDTPFPGLVVKCRGLSIREDIELRRLQRVIEDEATDLDGAEEAYRKQLALITAKILWWNAEEPTFDPDSGERVGATRIELSEGALYNLGAEVSEGIVTALRRAVRGVPVPLDVPSTSGEPLEVASIPTETLSASQAS